MRKTGKSVSTKKEISQCKTLKDILGNVDFAPDDGFDAVTLACRIEISRAVQVAVIGNRGGRHPEIFGACA